MQRVMKMLLAVVAGLAGLLWFRYLQRQKIAFPAPESLIAQPELAEDHDGEFNRVIRLEGSVNLRDIGGYMTHDGWQVRWGMVYRSGSLAKLTDEDLRFLEARNIKLICDLRDQKEVAAAPDRIPNGASYHHLALNISDVTRPKIQYLLLHPEAISDFMRDMYINYLVEQNAGAFGGLLRLLAQPDQLPALIHCTAGKDRTGISLMLLLSVLGVPEETIIADYTLSNLYYESFLAHTRQAVQRIRWLGVRGEDLYPLLVADAQTMQSVFNHIRTKYGSVALYLRDAAGVDDATIEDLRAKLLV